MEIKRICQPLHRYTFKAPLIKEWVEQNCEDKVLNLFAGITKLNVDETRIDLDIETEPDYCMDALEFVNKRHELVVGCFNTIILDPPYAYRKSMEKYKGKVASPFKQLKDAIVDILCTNGIVITFGYHSNSMGKIRGFELEKVLLINHGGAQHDTIAIIERKVRDVIDIEKDRIEFIKEEAKRILGSLSD